MTIYQWLTLFSVPTLIITAAVYTYRQIKAVKMGIQALLRAQLISEWNHYSEKGYAPLYARENFENVWKQYHNLGANGVMDDLRAKFLALSDRPPKEDDV